MLLVVLTFALFSTIFSIGKLSLQSGELFFMLGSRMLVAGVLMLGYRLYREPRSLLVGRATLPLILLSGGINFFLVNVFEFIGLEQISSWKSCFLYNLSPFITGLLSYLILAERLSWQKWLGLLIGCTGVSLIFANQFAQLDSAEWLEFGWAEASAVLAVVLSCLGWILVRRLRLSSDAHPHVLNGYGMAGAGAMCLVVSRITENWNPIPVTDGYMALLTGGYMLIISNLLGYNLYASLLKRYSATFLSLAGGMTALFAILQSQLLGEPINWETLVPAAILNAIGLILFHSEERKAGQRSPSPSYQADS